MWWRLRPRLTSFWPPCLLMRRPWAWPSGASESKAILPTLSWLRIIGRDWENWSQALLTFGREKTSPAAGLRICLTSKYLLKGTQVLLCLGDCLSMLSRIHDLTFPVQSWWCLRSSIFYPWFPDCWILDWWSWRSLQENERSQKCKVRGSKPDLPVHQRAWPDPAGQGWYDQSPTDDLLLLKSAESCCKNQVLWTSSCVTLKTFHQVPYPWQSLGCGQILHGEERWGDLHSLGLGLRPSTWGGRVH